MTSVIKRTKVSDDTILDNFCHSEMNTERPGCEVDAIVDPTTEVVSRYHQLLARDKDADITGRLTRLVSSRLVVVL